jgi:O-antigen chain-terminating methyltransferase
MSPDELDKLERQRRDADLQYNAALTAFDAALVRVTAQPPAGLVADSTVPPAPGGWRGWAVRTVQQWLTPWIARQHAFNARVVESIDALTARDRERAEAFERFQAALIAFLQQVTAFVETKDREQAAHTARRLDDHQRILDEQRPQLETVPELRAQIAVVQRATGMLKRRLDESSSQPVPAATATTGSQPAVTQTDSDNDYKYVGFEDQFRGSDEAVAAKLGEYMPLFAGAADVVDLGCGRGEFLLALRSAGVTARGVDTNADMVAVARERGLDVTIGDALGYVSALPDESIGGVIATQVVEHLSASYLMRLLDASHRAMRPGAPIVLETINPTCWYAFFSSYIRDLTHVHPVHPETLQYLLRASGFERVEIRYREPVPEREKLKATAVPEDVRVSDDPMAKALTGVARTLDTNAEILNRLIFTYMDYAVVGYRG